MLTIEKGHDSISKTFRLPIDLVNEMEKIADNNKISLNNLVIQCLEYAVAHIEPNDKKNMSIDSFKNKK